MDRIRECIQYSDNRSILECNEKGKSYKILNSNGKRISKVKVDGCVSQDEGEKRCDYLFLSEGEEVKQVIFVELKGGRLKDALQQIIDTVEYLREVFKDFKKKGRIIGSRDIPRFENNPEFKKLHKLLQGDVMRRTNKYFEETI